MTTSPNDDLDQLEAKINAAEHQSREENPATSTAKGTQGMGDAMRLAMDLVISVAIGTGLGLFIDNYFNTKPWFMLVFMIFGVAAGFRNFYLFAGKLLRPNAQAAEGGSTNIKANKEPE